MAKVPELQVLVPYKRLMELLEAAEALPELRKDLAWKEQQISALRHQFIELMEVVRDLRDEVSSL